MYQIDFDKPCRVHFIGIGGISMSGLAALLLEKGFTVSGSDRKHNKLTRSLEEKGAKIYLGQRASNVSSEIDVVVYTAAVHADNEEYAACVALGLPMLSRAQLLGELMKNYPRAAAIAGSHGKTTTTGMVSDILLHAEKDPTIVIGGILPTIGSNMRIGGSDCFVAEACEYTNSFLSFHPTVSAILNLELDHVDFFKDLEDIRRSFRLFIDLLPAEGLLVINSGIERLEELLDGVTCRVLTYGAEKGDLRAEEIVYDALGCPSFVMVLPDGTKAPISLNVPGPHNIENALAAAAMTMEMGVPLELVQSGLKAYGGVHRRFEKKGELFGVEIYDDFAHHPTEIEGAMKMARARVQRKLWCVFQPYTYSRTKVLMDEFADVLSAADEVLLTDIMAARETDTLGITSEDLMKKIIERGTPARYLPTFDDVVEFALENCINGDMLITMGCGDVDGIGDLLLGK